MIKDYIQIIDSLFPIDSESPNINRTGEKLLIETIKEIGWRNLSDNFLSLYSQKCEYEEQRQSKIIIEGN